MKNTFLLLLLLLSIPLYSQNIQWSYTILDHSSQKNSKENSAIQALGRPNSLSVGINSINTWQPKNNSGEEFIKVGFLTPIIPKQIVIIESTNPGYILKVLAYDAEGKEHEVITYAPKAVNVKNRILQINTQKINFHVFAIKIVLRNEKDISAAIDAIGISSSDKIFKIKESTNDIIKSTMVATKLDTTVNSKYPEMGPLISPDGKTLYFSRRGDPNDAGGKNDKEDIWYSEWDEKGKKWSLAKNIGAPLNNEEPNFINSISPDGNTILLGNSYLPDGTMEDGVSISQRTSNGWGTPRRLIIEDDSKNISKMANYFESNSQKILLISNNRKGDSYGDRDLYVSFVKADSTWTKPLNLGKSINTLGTESAPFLASDDRTLYFTSDGLNGYGGSDIYVTRRLDDTWTKWSEPENLGPVVNTAQDESYLTLTASGNQVFFTSQAKDEKDVDMYMLILPKILKPTPVMLMLGRVIDSKTNNYVPGVKIFFENLTTGVEVGIASSNINSGNFQMVLPSGNNYGYLAQKEGYISVNSNIDLTKMTEYKEFHKDLYITPIEIGQTVIINNIFFDFDKYDLRKESFLELNRLVTIIKNNSSMQIEISSNTDNIGTQAYNEILSGKRAESVMNYLVKNSGADKTRIILKNNGELKPIASNATAKGRQLNRRVQFKILAK